MLRHKTPRRDSQEEHLTSELGIFAVVMKLTLRLRLCRHYQEAEVEARESN